MAEYLLEIYVPAGGSTAGAGAGNIREATETVASQGRSVRYLRSMYVAADETCFVLLESDTVDTIQAVAQLARVPFDRISEVAAMSDLVDALQPPAERVMQTDGDDCDARGTLGADERPS
jgi:hypothetical protein